MVDKQPDGDIHGECAKEIQDLTSWIQQWAERLSCCRAATELPLPAQLHVQGQAHTIELTLREMCVVLKTRGCEVPIDC